MRVRYPYLNNSQIIAAGKKRDEQLEKNPLNQRSIDQSILSINSSKRREINS
jgi:hypothetical protein